jgi:hypothetical protein
VQSDPARATPLLHIITGVIAKSYVYGRLRKSKVEYSKVVISTNAGEQMSRCAIKLLD